MINSKWEFFIKKPNALIKMYIPQFNLLQAKLFNIFIYMIENKEKFYIDSNHELTINNIQEIKDNFLNKSSEVYFISLNYIFCLLNEKHALDKIKEAIRVISNIKIEINFDKEEFSNDRPIKEGIIESIEDSFIVCRVITKNIGNYLAIQFSQRFIDILNNNKKYFTYFKIVVLNNFSSLYAMKLYEHIFNKYLLGQEMIIKNNNSFINLGDLNDDYNSKNRALDENLVDYSFLDLQKIRQDYVIKEIRDFAKIINMDYDNLNYKVGNIKQLFDNVVLAEINNKFKEGLKELLINKDLQEKIKRYQKSKLTNNLLLVDWIWPEIMIRPIWLVRSKMHGAKDPRKICHVIFQFYRIVDVDIDKLLTYTSEQIDSLNFHSIIVKNK